MISIPRTVLAGVAATCLTLVAISPLFGQAVKNEDLRARVLALNDVTGNDPIKGEVKTLADKPDDAKKLIAAAVQMAKENDQPINYNGALILANVALRLNDLDAAEAMFFVCADQAAKLQSEHKMSQAAGGISVVIDELYQNKKYDHSTKLSQRFLETLERWGVKPEFKERVLRGLIQSMFKQGEVDKATRMVDNLLKADKDQWQNLKLKAWLELEKGNFDEAAKLYKDVLSQVAKDDKLASNEKKDEQDKVLSNLYEKIEDFFRKKEYEKSEKLCQRLTDILDKQGVAQALKDEIARWTVRSMFRAGHVDDAKQLLEKLVKRSSSDLDSLSLKAWIATETGHFDDAIRIHEDIDRRLSNDHTLDAEKKVRERRQNHYFLSGVYVEMNQVDKAAAELKALLDQDPGNSTYSNDLGYIWADHGKNLDEAEKLIRKALDADPKRASYLDSMGWVLFKKKNYPEAKKYLLEAVQDKDEGQHIEILDHLGDTHLMLGEKADAITVWKKALDIKPDTKHEVEKKAAIEQKVKKASQ
jgi:tetratricopeptide (TPR) repeat protein